MEEKTAAVWSAVERAARDAYGRLFATLAFRFRDISAVEDALSEALRQALERWPVTGIPASPEAWLTAVAKNHVREGLRRQAVAEDPRTTFVLERLVSDLDPSGSASDNRLSMMFVCAHPAIDASLRTPLMLQTVLGLDAARIGAAFLVAGPTMGQRLVRAKQKIRDAGIPFDPPEGSELSARLGSVLEGIYALFGAGWDDVAHEPRQLGSSMQSEPLDEEALFLAQLLTELVPQEPEALGLLALMSFSHARRKARFDAQGAFIPLALHDRSLWDKDTILHAEALLLRAATMRRPGPFQLEAAIQSAHCQRLFSGHTPWSGIALLYEALNRTSPTVASHVAHAAALAELGQLTEATARLAQLEPARFANYAPYWVTRARLALLAGDISGQRAALERAIPLTRDPALRVYLEQQLNPITVDSTQVR